MADVIRVNTEALQVEYLVVPKTKLNVLVVQIEYTTAATAIEEEKAAPGLFFCHG